ncbi:MAG: NAD(P)/FAD-dependent oxidoreductase [Chloroflexota bacterium]|nr:NAD(P)/FAD-dependent oxidoreductase [Chloroflexota bacterium]
MTSAGAARLDVVVVGGGPNGLAAAVALARAGRSVEVVEAQPTIGGGARSAALTLPGYVHDVCSAIHALARSSPFFRQLDLHRYGLRWIEPPVQLAHPFDDAETGFVFRDLDATAAAFGADGDAYRSLMGPVVRDWDALILGELAGPFRVPLNPLRAFSAARFGLHAIQPVTWLARRFRTPQPQALLAGCAAHSMLRMNEPLSGAFGLTLLGSAHAAGWPIAEGGSQRIVDALAACLADAGGSVVTGHRVTALRDLRPHRVTLLDLTPRQIVSLAAERLRRGRFGGAYVRQLQRYRYGPGVFKVDLALDAPLPWRDPRIGAAATVHLGGRLEEIAAGEAAIRRGRIPERPFVLLAQPSLFDSSRAPAGGHTVWAYCHVPNGSSVDMTDAILGQIERFAPGARERIVAMSTRSPADLERDNPNYVGGDIAGGLQDLRQFWTRPAIRIDPYRTPDPQLLICSSATPPGNGVHGLCGWFAARSALRGPLRE